MKNLYLKTVGIGIVAGMRSMMAPAFLARSLQQKPSPALIDTPLAWMGKPQTATTFTVLAAGEVVADKLPNTPSRLAPPVLGARILSGALCGATLFQVERKSPFVGALVGGAAAVAGSFVFYHLRHSAGQATKLPDPLFAVVEDALALGGGTLLLGENVWE